MKLGKQLRIVGTVAAGTVQTMAAVGMIGAAIPAVLYFGRLATKDLPPDDRKQLLHELLDLLRDIQQSQLGTETDCEGCGRYGYGFMLKTAVWEQALTAQEREAVHHGSKAHMILCPACVSGRLERPLHPDDFDPKYPINWPIFCAFELVHQEPCFDSIAALFEDAAQKARQTTLSTTPTPEYPLFCVDRGLEYDEDRYLGPFETLDEALERGKSAWAEHCEPRDVDPNPTFAIRRCRRVDGRDLGVARLLEILEEAADERLFDDPPAGAWADWEEPLVRVVDVPATETALQALLNEHFRCQAYVLEPVPEAQEAP